MPNTTTNVHSAITETRVSPFDNFITVSIQAENDYLVTFFVNSEIEAQDVVGLLRRAADELEIAAAGFKLANA